MIPSGCGGSCFFLTDDPDGTEKDRVLFSLGANFLGNDLLPDVPDSDGTLRPGASWDPVPVLATAEATQRRLPAGVRRHSAALLAAGPRLDTLRTNSVNTSLIDREGNVWLAGGIIPYLAEEDDFTRPRMVYPVGADRPPAVRVFSSGKVLVILTRDNRLFAMGKNEGQCFTDNVPAGDPVRTPVPILEDLTRSRTVTGICPTDLGILAVTSDGSLHYTGDNSAGTAGDRTQLSPSPGTARTVSLPAGDP